MHFSGPRKIRGAHIYMVFIWYHHKFWLLQLQTQARVQGPRPKHLRVPGLLHRGTAVSCAMGVGLGGMPLTSISSRGKIS